MEFFTMIKKHATKIKYLLVIAFFIIMIFSVEKYTNYLEILKAIKNVEKETSALQEKLDYITNFESRYLESDYSHFFLSHDNNFIFWGETIISFKTNMQNDTGEVNTLSHVKISPEPETTIEDNKALDPKDAWMKFFQERVF